MVQLEYLNLPKNREQALITGSINYFTGVECKNGHIDKRYTKTGICYSCKKINICKDYDRHKDRIIKTNQKSHQKHIIKRREEAKKRSKIYVLNNPEKRKITTKKYRDSNKEKLRQYEIERNQLSRTRVLRNLKNKEWRKNPINRLNKNIGTAVWRCLKLAKDGVSWIRLVNFTVQELKIHLETQFDENMNWENYGTYWEVDHIKPLSLCSSFEESWDLKNLQPLSRADNRVKGNNYQTL